MSVLLRIGIDAVGEYCFAGLNVCEYTQVQRLTNSYDIPQNFTERHYRAKGDRFPMETTILAGGEICYCVLQSPKVGLEITSKALLTVSNSFTAGFVFCFSTAIRNPSVSLFLTLNS